MCAFVRNELFRNICMEFLGDVSYPPPLSSGQTIRASDSLSLIIKRTEIYFTDIKVSFQVLRPNDWSRFSLTKPLSIQITRTQYPNNITNCTLLLLFLLLLLL